MGAVSGWTRVRRHDAAKSALSRDRKALALTDERLRQRKGCGSGASSPSLDMCRSDFNRKEKRSSR